MHLTVELDDQGRVVLPKAMRDQLDLSPGDRLDVLVDGREMTLRPHRDSESLEKERGVWVLRTGKPLSAEASSQAIRSVRETRTHRTA